MRHRARILDCASAARSAPISNTGVAGMDEYALDEDATTYSIEPIRDDAEGVIAVLEPLQPDALLLQGQEEAFDHPVLLGTVRRDVLLLEAVPAHDRHEDLRAEHQAVVQNTL